MKRSTSSITIEPTFKYAFWKRNEQFPNLNMLQKQKKRKKFQKEYFFDNLFANFVQFLGALLLIRRFTEFNVEQIGNSAPFSEKKTGLKPSNDKKLDRKSHFLPYSKYLNVFRMLKHPPSSTWKKFVVSSILEFYEISKSSRTK